MAIGGAIAAIASSAANVASTAITNQRNREEAYKMALFNNSLNQANISSQRQYDSPQEQMARAHRAGINPYTTLTGDTGISSPGANGSPIPHQPINFDLNQAVDAINKLEEMKFTSDENQKDRNAVRENMIENARLQTELEQTKLENELVKMEKQQDYDIQKGEINQVYSNQNREDEQAHQVEMQDNQFKHDTEERKEDRKQQKQIFDDEFGQRKDEFNKQVEIELAKLGIQENQNGWSIALKLIEEGADLIKEGDTIIDVVKRLANILKKRKKK